METIPIIDINGSIDEIVPQVARAAETIGFFAVVGHGISHGDFDRMRRMVAELFSVSDEDKHRQAILRDNYRGFIPLGFFTPNRTTQKRPRLHPPTATKASKLHTQIATDDPVCAESAIYGPNRWAEYPTDMAEVALGYWAQCERIAGVLLSAFEAGARPPG